MEFTFLSLIAIAAVFLSTIIFLANRFKRCPSDKILVIYGRVGKNQAARCIHGGGALIIPLIQDYAYLSLTPMTMSIPLHNALSLQNIRVHVPSTFTVGVSTDSLIMNNAAERLLGLKPQEIEGMAKEIVFGQLRLTVASLTIEQINQDRERFLEEIRKNVEPELNKIGLILINVNITDINDESDYIESIGKKASSQAINKALVDVAEQEKIGTIGQSEANREREIRVAENVASATKGKKSAESEQRIFTQKKEADAVIGENKSRAEIADANAELSIREAQSLQKSEVAKHEAQVAIQKAQYLAEIETQKASEIVPKEIERQQIEILAMAQADKQRIEAEGAAKAVLAKYNAEAEGIQKLLESKAAGYRKLVDSCSGDSKLVSTLLMIEKLDEIVKLQVEAIKNIKIDKITVWDSGNSKNGSSTSDFISSLSKSLPPLHDVAKMAGIELPGYLGKIGDFPDSPKQPEPMTQATA